MKLSDEQFGLIVMIGLICLTAMSVVVGVTVISLKKLDAEFYCSQQFEE